MGRRRGRGQRNADYAGDVTVHRDRQPKEDSLSTLVFREDSSTRPQPSPETLVAFDRRSDAFEPAHPGQLAHHGPAPAVGPFGRIFRKRDQPVVRADEQRTLQVGRILLENALVHTPRGTAVAIHVAESAENGVLAIADEGQGIPAAEQERVFERFFRLEGERSSGSGLGLAIAREWAMRMSGTVTLVSRPGATRFSLELPRDGDKA